MLRNKIVILILLMVSCIPILMPTNVFADEGNDNAEVQVYKIFDEAGNLLFERLGVVEGDEYLTRDFRKYRVVSVNDDNHLGKAQFVEYVPKPEVTIDYSPRKINVGGASVGLYMSHNDESYVPTDGTESVYGKGGIHDIARALQVSISNNGVTAYLDETLHIPHDSKAYSRSSVTANKLIKQHSPNALFDIHRDGSSRSSYVKKINGVERCKVRIVVGKASNNFKNAEKLAMYLLSVGEQMYDWLFLDIFYASGHYNQGLADKMLLFEMGSHMVEKELVLASVQPLADVITTALFNTTVNNNTGELTINGAVTPDTPLVDNALVSTSDSGSLALSIVLSGLIVWAVYVLIKLINNKRR